MNISMKGRKYLNGDRSRYTINDCINTEEIDNVLIRDDYGCLELHVSFKNGSKEIFGYGLTLSEYVEELKTMKEKGVKIIED